MFNLFINTKLSKDLPFYIEDFFYFQFNKSDIRSIELKKFHKLGIEGNTDIKIFPLVKPKIMFKRIGEEFFLNLSTHIKDKNLLLDFLDLISAYVHTTNMIGYLITSHDYEPQFPDLIFGNTCSSINITNNYTNTGIDYLAINAFPSLFRYITNTNLYKDK
jgi:hypothetical protein